MSAMASQTTGATIAYSTVWGADQRKHQSSTSLACVQGIEWSPVYYRHKGPVTRKMYISSHDIDLLLPKYSRQEHLQSDFFYFQCVCKYVVCGQDVTCRTHLNINSRDNFIHASPRIEDSASRVDIKCVNVNVDYEGWVSYLLGRNFFWSVFEKRDVPENGHCFQSLILSLSTLSPDLPCLSYDHVLTLITNEINLNSEKYSSLLHGHGNSKVNEIINE